jgi:hypothetical protein
MGYFSNLEMERTNIDREEVLSEEFQKQQEKKVEEKKYTYIFRAEGTEMYYGINGPVFNYSYAKKFTLTEVEARIKARSMRKKYVWKQIRV